MIRYISDVNPARAGMIPSSLRPCPPCGRKPRASGDDPKPPLLHRRISR